MSADFQFVVRGLTKEQAEAVFRVILAVVEALGGALGGGVSFPEENYTPE